MSALDRNGCPESPECTVYDSRHDLRVALPEAKRHRTLRGPREACKEIYEAAILEVESRVSALGVLSEETKLRGPKRVAWQLHPERVIEGEQIVKRLVACIGDHRSVPLQRGLSFADEGKGKLLEAVRQLDLFEHREPEEQRLEITHAHHQAQERTGAVGEVVRNP